MTWEPTVTIEEWGEVHVFIDGTDVTYLRGSPIVVESWSSGDPFSDASAVFAFPQVSPFETLGEGDLTWLRGHALVDIVLFKDGTRTTLWEGMIASIEESLSESETGIQVQCIGALYQLDYYVRAPRYINEARLYEVLIRDQFRNNSKARPHLKTKQCEIRYPDGFPDDTGMKTKYTGSWERVLTGYIQRLLADMQNDLTAWEEYPGTIGRNEVQEVVLEPEFPPFPWGSSYPSATLTGDFWLEFRGQRTAAIHYDQQDASTIKSRLEALPNCDGVDVSGNGTHATPWIVTFTGPNVKERSHPAMSILHHSLRHDHGVTRVRRLVSGQPTTMLETPEPWDGRFTLLKETGRKPVLQLRDDETVEFHLSVGQPGISYDLKRDYSQTYNVIYGEGTDESGTTWRNSDVTVKKGGTTDTDHWPIAWDESVHHAIRSRSPDGSPTERTPKSYSTQSTRVEVLQKYGGGISLRDARRSANEELNRISDPGWVGSITLRSDPEEMSRFEIQAGTNLRLRYFHDEENDEEPPVPGLVLHVAEVKVNFSTGSVELTVDSKARDLLTLSQMIERLKDERDPAKMLMVNRESGTTEDTKFPWDYDAGSGSIPKASMVTRYGALPKGAPSSNPGWFVKVNGGNHDPYKRWMVVPVVAAGKGSVSRSEIRAFNSAGSRLAIPFHVGVYQQYITSYDMPRNPFEEGALIPDPDDPSALSGYHPSAAVIWGQYGQRAGYWPSLESEGGSPTGILIDEGTWQFQIQESVGDTNVLYVAIYAEQTAYFQGRFFHGVQ